MTYKAPLKEMMLTMDAIAGLPRIQALPAFADYDLATAQAALEESAKICENVIAPLNREGDRAPSSWKDSQVTTTSGFKDACKQFIAGGWRAVVHPSEWGGQGSPNSSPLPAQRCCTQPTCRLHFVPC